MISILPPCPYRRANRELDGVKGLAVVVVVNREQSGVRHAFIKVVEREMLLLRHLGLGWFQALRVYNSTNHLPKNVSTSDIEHFLGLLTPHWRLDPPTQPPYLGLHPEVTHGDAVHHFLAHL